VAQPGPRRRQTRGRSGTFVATPSLPRQRLRYAQLGGRVGELGSTASLRDFSTGVPDYDLLPSLTSALRRIGDARLTTSYLDGAVLPSLETVLRGRWPFPPDQITVEDGVVGVAIDEHGMRPDALAAALASCEPVAVYLQPRAHNPTGASMTQARADKLARVLARHPAVTVIEDDHAGDIATAAPVSLGRRLPDRTVHVLSFSKSHGPDLRLAAIGGPADVVTAVSDRRLLGPGWSSRLLQAVLVDLLTDPSTVDQIAHARDEYARRRTALLDALDTRGVTATGADGINIWMPVANQQVALLTLAAHGIAVAPGAPFEVTHLDTDHVRITAGLIRDDFDTLADIFTEAAGAELRSSGPRTATHPRGWR
jgi:hypothetical protein